MKAVIQVTTTRIYRVEVDDQEHAEKVRKRFTDEIQATATYSDPLYLRDSSVYPETKVEGVITFTDLRW